MNKQGDILMDEPVRAVLGIDIGGTELKFCLLQVHSGAVLKKWKRDTRDGEFVEGVPAFANAIRDEILTLQQGHQFAIEDIGLAAPGLPGPGNLWIDVMPGRLYGLEKLNWTFFLRWHKPIRIINDGQSALLGEIWLGSAQKSRHVVMLTIGTGVGGAIFVHGRILRGASGRAGHIGHSTVDYRGNPDICRTPGSIEDTIGQVSLPLRSRGALTTFYDLAQALERSDPVALEIWSETMRALAAHLASIINLLDPELMVLGGGFLETSLPVIQGLESWMDQFEWRPRGKKVPIAKARLGQDAGAFGAAYAAMHPEVILD